MPEQMQAGPLGFRNLRPLEQRRYRSGNGIGLQRRPIWVGKDQIQVRAIIGSELLADFGLRLAMCINGHHRGYRQGDRALLAVLRPLEG